MTMLLELTCRDPIVSRDGRPFGAGQGNRMRSVGWPLPSVVAGSLRATIGKVAQRDFSLETAQELLQVEVAGILPLADDKVYFPAPQDCVVHPTHGPLYALPQAIEESGCDWPVAGLRPVVLSEAQVLTDFKPLASPTWWPVDRYAAWLAEHDVTFNDRFLRMPETEYRTHVQLDPNAGAAEDGNLFTTTALPLTHLARHGVDPTSAVPSRFAEITLAVRVRANDWCADAASTLDTLHPLGGERRLVHWKTIADADTWKCPTAIREALREASKVRMVLVTPAVFRDGWKPGWLNADLVGKPPRTDTALRLVGVSIERWRAASGWSLLIRPLEVLTRCVLDGGVLEIGSHPFRRVFQHVHVFVGGIA